MKKNKNSKEAKQVQNNHDKDLSLTEENDATITNDKIKDKNKLFKVG